MRCLLLIDFNEFDGYLACICEGKAEKAIMEILLDNNLLKFNKDMLLEGKVLSCRKAKDFEETYLNKGFKKQITVLRILDSKNEEFKLSKVYQNKVAVINIITAPEIEMLIIHAENKLDEFNKVKSKMKPSDFCKNKLGLKNVKSYDFVKDYFYDTTILLKAIRTHKSKSDSKGIITLSDLLN